MINLTIPHQVIAGCVPATAWLPPDQILDAFGIIREDMEAVCPEAVPFLVDWFFQYYVGRAALFPPSFWVIDNPIEDR